MIENNLPLERRDGETDFQYHKRLVYGKLEDKTLADYDYTELSKYVYGKEYSGDVARRLMYGSKKTLDLLESESISAIDEDSIVSDINMKIRELQKEQRRFFDQRREYNKLITKEARRDHLDSVLVDTIRSMNIEDLYAEPEYVTADGKCEAVLVLSDWHYGMTTDNVFNTYNTDVCKKRVKKVIAEAEKRIRLHGVSKLHILLLGDFIHGHTHVSARVASEELVIDQLMNVSEIIAQSINELSRYVESVIVYSTYGNHARVVAKKEDGIHADNMERVIGWWLTQRLASNERIYIADESTNEFIFASVCGYDVCATHGDLDSVKASPRLLPTLFQKKYGKDIDCIILGDKHHRESFEELGVTSMLCGALCGADDYASDRRLYSTPSQLMLVFDSDGIDAEYRLRCE